MKYISKKRIIVLVAAVYLVPAPMPGAVIGSDRVLCPSLLTAAPWRTAGGGGGAQGTEVGSDSYRDCPDPALPKQSEIEGVQDLMLCERVGRGEEDGFKKYLGIRVQE